MGTMYWVRVGFMILTFVGVMMTMRYMRSSKPTASPVAKMILGSGESQQFVLCPTRVTSLDTAAGFRLQQDGMKWERVTGDQHQELDPIAVEKWFGANCSVSGQAVETSQTFAPVLRLGYVSGQPQTLERTSSGEYRWEGKTFVSKTLDEALIALPDLPLRQGH